MASTSLAAIRAAEWRGRIRSALNQSAHRHSTRDFARLAAYWQQRAQASGSAEDTRRAERFARLAGQEARGNERTA